MNVNLKKKISPFTEEEQSKYSLTVKKFQKSSVILGCDESDLEIISGKTTKKTSKYIETEQEIVLPKGNIKFKLSSYKIESDQSTDTSEKADSNPFPFTKEESDATTTVGKESPTETKAEEMEKIFENVSDLDRKMLRRMINLFDCKYVPQNIILREKESKKIEAFARSCLDINSKTDKRILLISGMPGCGKSSLVKKVLEEIGDREGVVLKLNAMNFQKPFDLFHKILVGIKDAEKEKYEKGENDYSKLSIQEILQKIKSKTLKKNVLIVLDEIDSLFSMVSEASSRDLFNLFTIPSISSQIAVVGISNSMDLIIRLSEKYKTNIKNRENVVFEPYKPDAMHEIIIDRLDEFKNLQNLEKAEKEFLDQVFAPEAIKFCSSKMNRLKGGDIRCVFQALQEALRRKISEEQGPVTPVEIVDFNKTIINLFTKTKTNEILDKLPLNQQIVFLEIQTIMKRKNTLVMTQEEVFSGYYKLCQNILKQHTEKQAFSQILDVLESYNFISIDQGTKRKGKGFSTKGALNNRTLKVLISREEIIQTLQGNQNLKGYL